MARCRLRRRRAPGREEPPLDRTQSRAAGSASPCGIRSDGTCRGRANPSPGRRSRMAHRRDHRGRRLHEAERCGSCGQPRAGGHRSSTSSGGADLFRLEHRKELEALFGEPPSVRASFLATSRAAWRLASGLDRIASLSIAARSVEARAVFRDAIHDLHRIGERWETPHVGADAWSELESRTRSWVSGLSSASSVRTRTHG